MPQLDKVTLFSQVFWLILLYFFFFLIFLNFSLPYFSKIFKVRLFFLEKNKFNSQVFQLTSISYFMDFLENLIFNLKNHLALIIKYCQTFLITYNSSLFQKVNILYINIYLFNYLKLNFSKKLYI